MILEDSPIPLLVIAGPTAAGKTAAAIEVAGAVGGEIVSADSMQIYRGMDIGTAKPTPQEQRQATFRLIDIVDPDEDYNVALFQKDAQRAIVDIHRRGLLPILCGGTGLYIQAVVEHFDFPPGPRDERTRQRLEENAAELGTEKMHHRLREVDPEAATRIEPQDLRRIVRALEVYELTGQPLSQQQCVDETAPVKYNMLSYVLTCPRALLYQRIERRVDEMMSRGWLAEVQRLRRVGYHRQMQSMQAIGYRHLLEYLEEGTDLDKTVADIKRDIRQFAKRQLTWFRNRTNFDWLTWSDQQQWKKAAEQLTKATRRLMAHSR
ncbi:MAG: tRNA (adenosine(37)-N6)-dimethylallyltransferase MiaA [Armatimonadetes bacterium]|nr:tRNA (adenosine(37)-N6)-dimethylallyltransferase MiaA [Armatimonadota bacterium]